MLIDLKRFGVVLLSSTILLSGCMQNENEDATPPEREEPVEQPETEDPNSENPNEEDPGAEDPGPGDGDPGGEDPGSEDPGGEDPGGETPPSDGAESTPYSNGTQLFGLLDSEIGSPNVIREERNISGSSITYDITQVTSDGGSWTEYTDVLPYYIMGDDGSGSLFVEMKPETFQLDTSAYTLAVDSVSTTFDIKHIFYDGSGQDIKDFIETNMQLPRLGQYLSPSQMFDGSAFIYKEVLTNPENIVVYFSGNHNGSNCQLVNGTSLSETLSSTKNCNVIVDGGLNAITSIGSATGTDLASAPTLRMSAIIDEDIKLKSHGISGSGDSGDVHLASDADPDNNIGYYQTISNVNGDYFEVVINNLESQTYFEPSYLPWTGISKLVMAEQGGFVRLGAVIPATSELDQNTYLLNDSALNQVLDSVMW